MEAFLYQEGFFLGVGCSETRANRQPVDQQVVRQGADQIEPDRRAGQTGNPCGVQFAGPVPHREQGGQREDPPLGVQPEQLGQELLVEAHGGLIIPEAKHVLGGMDAEEIPADGPHGGEEHKPRRTQHGFGRKPLYGRA